MDDDYTLMIFENHWKAERAQAEMELRAIERERAIEDIVRLIRTFEISPRDIAEAAGEGWLVPTGAKIELYQPYFGSR